jgi:hypothetical protein
MVASDPPDGAVLDVRGQRWDGAVSRYVEVALGEWTLAEVAAALTALGLAHQAGEQLLDGSLECAGEPVHVRVEPAPLDAVEDLGFRLDEGRLALVCGELDRDRLVADLLPRLRAAVAEVRLRAGGLAVEAEGLGVARTIRVRRR